MFVVYAKTHDKQHTLQTTTVSISTGAAFFLFCGMIIQNAFGLCCRKKNNACGNNVHFEEEQEMV